jgi:hypothetical protein
MLLVGEQLADNARLVLVAAGACWLYIGIAGFSLHAADMFAGSVLMGIGAYPYLRRPKGTR